MNAHSLMLILALLAPAALHAQTSFGDIGYDFENAGRDVIRVWLAPVHIDADDLPEIAAAAAAIGFGALLDRPIQDFIRAHPQPVRRVFAPFIAPSPLTHFGALGYLTMLSGALYAGGVAFDHRPLRDAGMGCLAAGWANSIARHGLYALVSRTRPSETEDPFELAVPGGDWHHRSFFGGHASNIMTCASVWNERFDLGLAGPALYLVATGIAFGRTVDGAHWTSDTVAGLIAGYAVGRLVAHRQRERVADEGSDPVFYVSWRVPL